MAECSAGDCERQAESRGMCHMHYQRWWRPRRPEHRAGPPLDVTQFTQWYAVDPETGCWLWTRSITSAGYGQIVTNNRNRSAHRLAYELHVGPIPEGLELDHLCRVPRCVNPAHLEPVTHAENIRRAMKTHCKRGHPFDGEHVQVTPQKRVCLLCVAIRTRERSERLKSLASRKESE